MLEPWLSSFISGNERRRPPVGLAAPPPRGVPQGWLKDPVEIRLGEGLGPKIMTFQDFPKTPRGGGAANLAGGRR